MSVTKPRRTSCRPNHRHRSPATTSTSSSEATSPSTIRPFRPPTQLSTPHAKGSFTPSPTSFCSQSPTKRLSWPSLCAYSNTEWATGCSKRPTSGTPKPHSQPNPWTRRSGNCSGNCHYWRGSSEKEHQLRLGSQVQVLPPPPSHRRLRSGHPVRREMQVQVLPMALAPVAQLAEQPGSNPGH